MGAGDILFFLAAAVSIAAAVVAVTDERLLHSVLAFGVFLFAIACAFLVMGAEFVAVAQIFVYVGGVAVLILFGVMLTASRGAQRTVETEHPMWAMVCALVLAGTLIAVAAAYRPTTAVQSRAVDVSVLGRALLGPQLFGFELIGLILLASVIAALAVVRRETGR